MYGIDELQTQQEKQQRADECKALGQRWENTTNGTYFRHIKNGSLWLKEEGLLRDTENRFVPDGLIVEFLPFLEEIQIDKLDFNP